MHISRTLGIAIPILLICSLPGCGGGGNSPEAPSTQPPTPIATITSVGASCASAVVPVAQSSQCTATVKGTGNFNSSVNWSVNTTLGGNTTIGTVNEAGLYTAPAVVPTPFTVTITATSAADSTKAASTSVIVAGTIASVSQNISAASGGTITLPDGSSVTVAAGVLPSDQSLTLSEVSYLPNQPPNRAITGVGPGLILAFEVPVQPSTTALTKPRMRTSRVGRANATAGMPMPFHFSVNVVDNNVSLLSGSLPTANFVDGVGINTFTGVDGNYDSTVKVVTGNVRSDLLAGLTNRVISAIEFSAMNVTSVAGFLPLIPGPVKLDEGQSPSRWTAYDDCPTGKTLVLVHGMFSSVERAFPPTVAEHIQKAGTTKHYDSVVGFDYDWLLSIKTSGKALASFLDTLVATCGLTVDIEAHSEGVAVSMAALTQTKSGTNDQVAHLVSLGGPIMGTPAADDLRILQGLVLATPDVSLATELIDLATILASPFVTDLLQSTRGDGSTLDLIRAQLSSRSERNAPQVIVVGGNAERIVLDGFTIDMSWAAPLIGTNNFDGIIPVTSALAFDSGLKVYPLFPFNVGHTELEGDTKDPSTGQSIISAVGQQVTEARTPELACVLSPCESSQGSTFQFTGSEFSPDATSIAMFNMDSTGAVVYLPTSGLVDNDGIVTWSMPICADSVGLHSVFAFDGTLASNDVNQIVDAGTCPSGLPGTISTVAGNNTAGYSGDGGSAINAQLFVPTGVAFDSAGNMFIADSSNNVIRRVDFVTGNITTVAGNGFGGYSGDGGPATIAQLNGPTQLAFDGSGNLYIADANNARIRKIDSAGTISTFAGNGTPGFAGDGGPASSAELNFRTPCSSTVRETCT
jgi:hypothetical protein